jgi:hypothetical protein
VARADDGRILVKCHKGCETANVLAAIDPRLTLAFLQPVQPPRRREPLHRYVYEDADGRPVAVKLRYSGRWPWKWQQPDGTPGLDGINPGLYHMPEVVAAVAAHKLVLVCEGERDADTARAHGYVATTTPYGAGKGKWDDCWAVPLAGADVIVIADGDDTGVAYAYDEAEGLTRAGCAVDVLVPPRPHNDLTDLFEAGGGFGDLVDIDRYESPDTIRRTKDGREFFSQLPERWATTLDGSCHRIVSLVDADQQNRSHSDLGRNQIADKLTMSRPQVTTHLKHLNAAGIIKSTRDGQKRTVYRVINPSRTPQPSTHAGRRALFYNQESYTSGFEIDPQPDQEWVEDRPTGGFEIDPQVDAETGVP